MVRKLTFGINPKENKTNGPKTIHHLGPLVVIGFAGVWPVDGKHSNNTADGGLPSQTALIIPLCTPRSASHGGDAHFWAMVVPILACGDRFNCRRQR